MKQLNIEQRGLLFTALMCYQTGEPQPQLDIQTQMAFMFMASQMDRDNQKYDQVSAKRRNAANARWSKQKMQKHNLHYDTETDTDSDTDTDTDTDNETDTEGQIGPDGLSLKVRQALDQEFGRERVTELIDEVNLWAINNGKDVPDLAAMVRTFAKNQKRWGGGRKPAKMEMTLDEIFKGID